MKRALSMILVFVLLFCSSSPAFADSKMPTAVNKHGYTVTGTEYTLLYKKALKTVWEYITDSTLKDVRIEETQSASVYHVTVPALSSTEISLQLYANGKEPGKNDIIDSAAILVMGEDGNEDMYLFFIAATALILLADNGVEDVEEAKDILDEVMDASLDSEPYTHNGMEYTMSVYGTIYFLGTSEL